MDKKRRTMLIASQPAKYNSVLFSCQAKTANYLRRIMPVAKRV